MMIFRKSFLLFALLGMMVLYSCSDKGDDPLPEPEPPVIPKPSFASGWDSVHAGTTSVYDIQFTDANTGYFVGDKVYKTTDGGKTWLATNAPSYFNTGYEYASFLNASVGWVLNARRGFLIKTIDGGQNWQEITIGGEISPFLQIKFTDENNGYIVGQYCLLKSTNGGITWKQIYQSSTRTGPALFFIDDKTGWISEAGGITRTTDGATFTKTAVSNSTSIFYSIQFLNKLEGFALERNGQIWQTSDGGVTWTPKIKVDVGDSAHDLHFFDKENGYVSGVNGIVKVTAGNTSTTVKIKNIYAWEMFFLNKDTGFVGSSSRVLFQYKTPK